MSTINNRKYIGSGEDAIVPDEVGSVLENKKEGEYNPIEVYQQTEEEACCSATGE